MYLTAQRPTTEEVVTLGINAYYYRHNLDWAGHPPLRLPPPVFVRGHETVPKVSGVSRRLRSYVDVVAPDSAAADEVHRAFDHLDFQIASGVVHAPWVHVCGRVSVQFELEAALANVWRAELYWLSEEARRVWSDSSYRTL